MMVMADDRDDPIDPERAQAAASVRQHLREVAMLIADAVTHPGIGLDLLLSARNRCALALCALDALIAAWAGVPLTVDDVPTAPLTPAGAPDL